MIARRNRLAAFLLRREERRQGANAGKIGKEGTGKYLCRVAQFTDRAVVEAPGDSEHVGDQIVVLLKLRVDPPPRVSATLLRCDTIVAYQA
jgi:hypothetical protein